jgi:hypothetical protein
LLEFFDGARLFLLAFPAIFDIQVEPGVSGVGMKKFFISVFMILGLSACATDGARTETADHVVTIVQAYTATEPQALNVARADSQALAICQRRGYTGAEKIGQEKQVCTRYTGWYRCFYRQVEQRYQCTE